MPGVPARATTGHSERPETRRDHTGRPTLDLDLLVVGDAEDRRQESYSTDDMVDTRQNR